MTAYIKHHGVIGAKVGRKIGQGGTMAVGGYSPKKFRYK